MVDAHHALRSTYTCRVQIMFDAGFYGRLLSLCFCILKQEGLTWGLDPTKNNSPTPNTPSSFLTPMK